MTTTFATMCLVCLQAQNSTSGCSRDIVEAVCHFLLHNNFQFFGAKPSSEDRTTARLYLVAGHADASSCARAQVHRVGASTRARAFASSHKNENLSSVTNVLPKSSSLSHDLPKSSQIFAPHLLLSPTCARALSLTFSPTLSPPPSPTLSPPLSPTLSPPLSPTLSPPLSPPVSLPLTLLPSRSLVHLLSSRTPAHETFQALLLLRGPVTHTRSQTPTRVRKSLARGSAKAHAASHVHAASQGHGGASALKRHVASHAHKGSNTQTGLERHRQPVQHEESPVSWQRVQRLVNIMNHRDDCVLEHLGDVVHPTTQHLVVKSLDEHGR
eukprot:6203181-Pleurochrysis_carterae.AAC.6